ncbi:MAG TPA: DUF3829 domain-containing protein [Polyangiaceae bacterium]|nr:DUF3829 domain-containing protein [Polyangiaceae bacterium]
MKNSRINRQFLGCLTLSIALAVAPDAGAAGDAKPVTAAAKLAPPPDAKSNAKVNGYIQMMNRESARLFEERSSWLSQIDPKQGPTCKEQSLGLNGIDSGAEARYAGYKKTVLAKPKLEVDEAALKMVEALQALRKPAEDDRRTFSNPELKAEKCKRSKELFPVLLANWNQYLEGHEIMSAFVDKFTDERDLREVETTAKKYGKRYRYHFALIVNESKALLRTIATEAHKPEPSSAPIVAKLTPFNALIEESKQLLQSDGAAKKGQPYPPGLSLMLSDSMPRFQKSVSRYIATLDNKTAKNRVPQAKSDWGYVTDCYNQVVDQMNGVRFDKSQK